MIKYFVNTIFVISVCLIACSKNTSPGNDTLLSDKWVRVDLNTDTMDFSSFMPPGADEKYFVLKRAYKLNSSGNRQPVEKEGPYSYQIAGEQVNIQWMLSSCMNCTSPYYFSLKGNTIQIGNFIDHSNDVLTFRKVQ